VGETGSWLTSPMTASRFPMLQRAGFRTTVAAALGLVTALIWGVVGRWAEAPAVGWDLAAVAFLAGTWRAILPLDAGQTAEHALSEDPTKELTRVIVLGSSVASLAGVGFLLIEAHSGSSSGERAAVAGLGVGTIAVSWFVVHTLFTLRYALLYYVDSPGGIDFNQDERPRYSDFAYLAFTIGMTFQVSDTDLKTHAIRITALRHALLSFMFDALILAASVNLIASLAG
jgi:uncharacterized membrane protein